MSEPETAAVSTKFSIADLRDGNGRSRDGLRLFEPSGLHLGRVLLLEIDVAAAGHRACRQKAEEETFWLSSARLAQRDDFCDRRPFRGAVRVSD